MKKYFLIFISIATILVISTMQARAHNFPSYAGYVNDFAGIIDGNTVSELDSAISSFNNQTGIQIAVVTVKNTGDLGIDEYANELFKKWGVGVKGLDNGVMLIVSTEEKQVRIEVGYGLEPGFTDEQAGSIIRNYIVPAFKEGQFSHGIAAGTLQIIKTLAQSINQGDISSHASAAASSGANTPNAVNTILGILLFIVFIYFAIRHPFITLFLLGSGFGGGFGGRSGGGFGGGFGGFGGGLSGGGGASGGW